MSQQQLTEDRATVEPATADDAIYEALVAALRSSARGRAFLDEYARRARAADTGAALQALARIEALLLRQAERPVEPPPTADVQDIHPDDAYVPFEFDWPADTAAPVETAAPHEAQVPQQSSTDLLAQVMALSPEERIALFS